MKLGINRQDELCERAKSIWHQFNHKIKWLTDNPTTIEEKLHFHLNSLERSLALYEDKELQAVKTMVNWWRYNNADDIKLLNEIEQNPWQSTLFRQTQTHYNGLNLFSSGNITWQQQATLSMIIDTKQVFGDFEAIPLLNDYGTDFSEKAKPLVQNFIRYSPLHTESPFRDPSNCFLTDEETQLFFALVRQLPKSEQFIFHFKEQHNNEKDPQGAPSKDLNVRFSYSRLLNRKGADYHGALVFSHGIRNAIGLSHYDVDDWVPLIPHLGPQSIDDVEFHVVNGTRPTVSGESEHLGFIEKKVNIHGTLMEGPDQFAHDEYHSWIASILGSKVLKAIDELILLTRNTFGIRWSKDIWILRDSDLTILQNHGRDLKDKSPNYTTELFAHCLNSQYHSAELLNCTQELQMFMEGRPLLLGPDKFPSQILLNFALDLVFNANKWKSVNILDDENLYFGVMPRLIKMVKYLRKLDVLDDYSTNSKRNILMLDYFVRSQGPCYNESVTEYDERILTWNNWQEPKQIPKDVINQMREMGLMADAYFPTVYNKKLMFGFKNAEEVALKPQNKKAIKKRNRQGEIAEQIERNPELRQDALWLKSQFLKACETENTDDIEYFLEHFNCFIDYELLMNSISIIKSMRFFDWFINTLKILKTPDGERYPNDFMDLSDDMEVDCSEEADPQKWTSDYILLLKESDSEDAEVKLNQMKKQFIVHLNKKRESIIREEASAYHLKKARCGN